jgi:hypothetical protein
VQKHQKTTKIVRQTDEELWVLESLPPVSLLDLLIFTDLGSVRQLKRGREEVCKKNELCMRKRQGR